MLVYGRVAPDITAVPVPIPHSGFYHGSSRVHLKHYRAILHEYAAILYYRFKGWL
jgi:hypothetical protein